MTERTTCSWVGMVQLGIEDAELALIEQRAPTYSAAARDDVSVLLVEVRRLYARYDRHEGGKCRRQAIARYRCKSSQRTTLVLRCKEHDPETHERFKRGEGGLVSRESLPAVKQPFLPRSVVCESNEGYATLAPGRLYWTRQPEPGDPDDFIRVEDRVTDEPYNYESRSSSVYPRKLFSYDDRPLVTWPPQRPPRCGKYLGDNDATSPQLTCIREKGHPGLCDNTSDLPDTHRDGGGA